MSRAKVTYIWSKAPTYRTFWCPACQASTIHRIEGSSLDLAECLRCYRVFGDKLQLEPEHKVYQVKLAMDGDGWAIFRPDGTRVVIAGRRTFGLGEVKDAINYDLKG